MTLFDHQTIIYLTRNKAWLLQGSTKTEIDCTGKDYEAIFTEIKAKIGTHSLAIILGDDLNYTTNLLFGNEKPNDASVQAKMAELVPEEISAENLAWHSTGKNTSGEETVQVFVMSKEIQSAISMAADRQKINIEFFVPITLLLALACAKTNTPELLLWGGEEKLAALLKDGVLYNCERIETNPSQKIEELVDFARENFDFKVTEALVAMTDDSVSLPKEITSKKIEIDIIAAIRNFSTQDLQKEGILFLRPLENTDHPAKDEKTPEVNPGEQNSNIPAQAIEVTGENQEAKPKSSPWPAIILIFLFVLLLAGGAYAYYITFGLKKFW